MLHIDEIKERLKINPEPKEVSDMRNHILDSFKNLQFIEEGHIYNILNDEGNVEVAKIPSATSIIHRFETYVDWEEKAENYALKTDRTKEDVQRQWRENNLKATNNGSRIHEYGECLQKFITTANPSDINVSIRPQYESGYLIPYGEKQWAIMSYWTDLFNCKDIYPLLPECKMYLPLKNKFGIEEVFCGTADITLAYKHKGKWSIIVHDFKTNGSLTNTYNRSNNVTMLPPFDDMTDEALSHYTIQLSLYSMMLENIGYNVIDRKLIWLKDDSTYKKIQLPYIKDKIIESFRIFNEQ